MKFFKGKVVKLIDSYCFIISKQIDEPLKEDLRGVVYYEGEMIFDPDTNEALECLAIIKGRFHITQVQDTIAWCRVLPKDDADYNRSISDLGIQVGDLVSIYYKE